MRMQKYNIFSYFCTIDYPSELILNKQNRKIYIPGKDLQYTGKCDIKLFDFFHRASEDLYKVLRPIYDSMSFL